MKKVLRSAVPALLLAAGCLAPALAPPAHAAVKLEKAREAQLLGIVSTAPEKQLRAMEGMTPDAASKILAARKGGKGFASVEELLKATGLTDAAFDAIATPFTRTVPLDEVPRAEGETSPATPAAAAPGGKKAALAGERTGSDAGAQAPGGGKPEGLGLEAQGGYYSILPGYDLSKVPEDKKKAFLDRINSEMCTCGCQNETLAYCLVNDPGCPVVKARVRKIHADMIGADGAPPSSKSGS